MRCETCHRDAPDDADFCPHCGKALNIGAATEPFDYAAFISYRHLPRDQEVAKRVQKAIETYKLPRGIAGQKGARTLGKCFRDEDELAAAHSLPDRILDALKRSSALVVICTPDTQDSVWVQREIEAFVGMHGRERVFVVLADGSSAESIPGLLQSKSGEGEESGHASPLAADMRPEAAKQRREETLRLIAGIAGCGYDDLRQRDRLRRRKRNTATAIAAILVVASIAAALAFASAAHQDSLATESRKLAAESEQLLSQGDRYGAIEKALEALPRSESSNDRPYVVEARAALEDALQIEFDERHPWNLRYAIDAKGDIELMRISPNEGWFAILDSEITLSVYEISTGRKLSEAQLLSLIEGNPTEKDLDPAKWSLTPAVDKLIVWERGGSYVLCCIEAESGDVAWKYNDVVNALSVSDDGEIATLLSHYGDEFYVGAINIPTGEWLGSRKFDNPGIPDYTRELPSRMGSLAATLYVGFDHIVAKYNILDDSEALSDIPNSDVVYSIAPAEEAIIVLSSTLLGTSEDPTRFGTATFTVTALDEDMQTIWANSGTWSARTIDSKRGFVGVDHDPIAEKFLMAGGPAIVVLAGNSVRVLSCEDGATIYEETFDSPVVGADPFEIDADDFVLYVTCADGDVRMRRLNSQGSPDGPIAFSYPGPVDNAHLDFCNHKGFFAIARSLDDSHRMFVYQAETRTAKDAIPASDYSLDELISMAHNGLDAVAQ